MQRVSKLSTQLGLALSLSVPLSIASIAHAGGGVDPACTKSNSATLYSADLFTYGQGGSTKVKIGESEVVSEIVDCSGKVSEVLSRRIHFNDFKTENGTSIKKGVYKVSDQTQYEFLGAPLLSTAREIATSIYARTTIDSIATPVIKYNILQDDGFLWDGDLANPEPISARRAETTLPDFRPLACNLKTFFIKLSVVLPNQGRPVSIWSSSPILRTRLPVCHQ
jgi:hypothetical protein